MATELAFENREIVLPTGKISYLEAGFGPPLIWLHHSWGSPGTLPVHGQLAEHFSVIVPDMPGWGGSERPMWARTVRDVAILLLHFAKQITSTSYSLVGAGLGAYVASEMACMAERSIRNVVLLGPAGVKPDDGEIMDQMMFSHRQYVEESFKDRASYLQQFGEEPAQEVRELWDHSREMTARVSWKPYMFNRRLAQLLRNIQTPFTVVWGEHDKVTPLTLQAQYQEICQNVEVHTLAGAGHVVEIEQPDAVTKLITESVR